MEKARVLRARPQRRLAETRVSHQRDVLRVDFVVALDHVHRTAQRPSPCADRAPLIVALGRLGAHAVFSAAIEIGLDIVVAGDGESVARVENLLHLPARGFRGSGVFRSGALYPFFS
jgi:hypothetical protein